MLSPSDSLRRFHGNKSAHVMWGISTRSIAEMFGSFFLSLSLLKQGYSLFSVGLLFGAAMYLVRVPMAPSVHRALHKLGGGILLQISNLVFIVFVLSQVLIPGLSFIKVGTIGLLYSISFLTFAVSGSREKSINYNRSKSSGDASSQYLIVSLFSIAATLISSWSIENDLQNLNIVVAIVLALISINLVSVLRTDKYESETKSSAITLRGIMTQKMSRRNVIGLIGIGVLDVSGYIWTLLLFYWGFSITKIGTIAATGAISAIIAYFLYHHYFDRDKQTLGVMKAAYVVDIIANLAKSTPMTLPLAYILLATSRGCGGFYMPARDALLLHNINASSNPDAYNMKVETLVSIGKGTCCMLFLIFLPFFDELASLRIGIFSAAVVASLALLVHYED